MAPRQHPKPWQILVQIRQHLRRTRRVPPVAHKITNDSKQRDKVHTSFFHARVGRITVQRGRGTGALDVGEDGVAFCTEGEGKEGSANIRHDAADDDLLFAGCFDGVTELGIVPSAKYSQSSDQSELEMGRG